MRGQTPVWNSGNPRRGGGQPPLEKGGLCALGLRGLGGREGTREPGSLGCVLEVRGAVPPPPGPGVREETAAPFPRGAQRQVGGSAGRWWGGGAEAGASATLWALVVRLPGLEAGSGPLANECQLW